jgi:hypothetical protein
MTWTTWLWLVYITGGVYAWYQFWLIPEDEVVYRPTVISTVALALAWFITLPIYYLTYSTRSHTK